MPPRRALLTHWLTAPQVTPRAVATSCCFQPCWTNSQTRSRRASFQSVGAASLAIFMRWIVSHTQLSYLWTIAHASVNEKQHMDFLHEAGTIRTPAAMFEARLV